MNEIGNCLLFKTGVCVWKKFQNFKNCVSDSKIGEKIEEIWNSQFKKLKIKNGIEIFTSDKHKLNKLLYPFTKLNEISENFEIVSELQLPLINSWVFWISKWTTLLSESSSECFHFLDILSITI